jgi:hypothetical protein
MSVRLTKVEPDVLQDHGSLSPEDICYYLYEYTARQRYDYSDGNQLISNLKKKPSVVRQRLELMRYKQGAEQRCAQELFDAMNKDWLRGATLVPVPPSKAMGDPDYDDRLYRILGMLQRRAGQQIDIRKLINQTQSTRASHETEGNRLSVEELLAVYRVDPALLAPTPRVIGVFDDMLTAGNHFRAMKIRLGEVFPDVVVVGLFISRRVLPQDFGPLF